MSRSNLITRALSGTVYLAAVLVALLTDKFVFAALMTVFIAMTMSEFYRMTLKGSYLAGRTLAIIFGVCIFWLFFFVRAFGLPVKYMAISIVFIIAIMAFSLAEKDKDSFRLYGLIYTGLVYIVPAMAMTNILVFSEAGHFDGSILLSVMIIVWASDVGAYLIGMLLGKNGKKLCPGISPNKSWAGFWGGLVCALGAGAIVSATGLMPFPMIHAIIVSAIINVMGVLGDLFESVWKRITGVKDSGHIIPGHGGFLDRLDSTVFAIPSATVYLLLANLI